MNSEIKTQLCKEDFYLMMRHAVIQAGGADDLSKWKEMKLEELVNLFAQNGIRMIHMPSRHMDAIKVTWEDPKKPKSEPCGKREDGPLPKKKQLLCDSLDKGEEEDDCIWGFVG